MLHILTKFYDDDLIQTKIMAISSTGTSGVFSVSLLARVHNSFDTNDKNSKFFYSFYYFLLFVFCSNFDALSDVQEVH